MVSQDSLLVTLVKLVDRVPMPALSTKRGRGHPQVYSDRLFLKALVIMLIRHLHNVQIACLGRHLLDMIQPWVKCGRAVAIDSTILRAR